ncbi:hypothetical protein WDU94_011888 [Cyamophila willieti]
MLDWYGLAGIIIFYTFVLAIGVWAGTKQKNNGEEEVMLAGRNVGLFVGVLTLTATWVGGGYINGTAEALFTTGLAWCQVPIGYSMSLIVGAILFVKPMREANYITMLDPFQVKYGNRIGGLLFLPALCGDVFWIASVLASLGASLTVILEISNFWSVTISTVFAAAYTVAGGLYSVTYTDVLQLILIVIGLCLSFPFAVHNSEQYLKSPNLTIFSPEVDWIGHVDSQDYGVWIESLLLLVFGGIPWQAYFQRVLSLRSTKSAYYLSVLSALFCILMAIPAGAFGIIARMVDWKSIPDYGKDFNTTESNSVLPLVLRELCPNWVAFFGLGAVTAAVMSSADAGILSSSSMFTRNIYKLSFRPKASENELIWVLRIAIAVIASLACLIALTSSSIYYLSVLCSDIVYVILFPQLILVIYWDKGVNGYGCLSAYFIGLVLRILGGEPGIGLPQIIKYPGYDVATQSQKFPFKTFAMLASGIIHVIVSTLAAYVFRNNLLSPDRWDVLGAFPELHINRIEKEHNGKELRTKEGIVMPRSNKPIAEAVKGTRYSDVTIISTLDQSPPDGSVVAHEFSKF